MRRRIFMPVALSMTLLCSACVKGTLPEKTKSQTINVENYTGELVAAPIPIVTGTPERTVWKMSEKDIAQIALVTMAEAEGECEEGKRLVIDTILNRMDSEYFPDTVEEVLYQPYQFSSIWNGRAERCEVREDICKLVREELALRRNYNVIFFSSDGYSSYGVPVFQVGNHYFSNYN